jgi:serine/threonine protein kinase
LLLKDQLSSLGSCLGTFDFCAPEVLLGNAKATEKADLFSYGVLLFQMFTGEPPVRGRLRPLDAPRECPLEVAELQQRCLDADPAQRPSAAEVVEVLTAYTGRHHPTSAQQPPHAALPTSQGRCHGSSPQVGSMVRSVVIPPWPVASSPMLESRLEPHLPGVLESEEHLSRL